MSRTVQRTRRKPAWRGKHKAAAASGQPHGYLAVLGLGATDTAGLIGRVEAGLPFSAFQSFVRTTGLPAATAAEIAGLTLRTLARRKLERRLRPDESDRLVRAARVYAQAVDLFEGDETQARRWLTAPQPALGGATPVRYAATEVGAREVEALVGRLEHGIPT